MLKNFNFTHTFPQNVNIGLQPQFLCFGPRFSDKKRYPDNLLTVPNLGGKQVVLLPELRRDWLLQFLLITCCVRRSQRRVIWLRFQ